MKLRQNGIVSFSIKLAAFQASGGAEIEVNPDTMLADAVGPALGSLWYQPPRLRKSHGTLTHEYPGNRNICGHG
jgi:hypothetical protein